jgi:hypothetical protein
MFVFKIEANLEGLPNLLGFSGVGGELFNRRISDCWRKRPLVPN